MGHEPELQEHVQGSGGPAERGGATPATGQEQTGMFHTQSVMFPLKVVYVGVGYE